MKDKEMKRNTVSVMRITIKVVMILAFLAIWASVAAGPMVSMITSDFFSMT